MRRGAFTLLCAACILSPLQGQDTTAIVTGTWQSPSTAWTITGWHVGAGANDGGWAVVRDLPSDSLVLRVAVPRRDTAYRGYFCVATMATNPARGDSVSTNRCVPVEVGPADYGPLPPPDSVEVEVDSVASVDPWREETFAYASMDDLLLDPADRYEGFFKTAQMALDASVLSPEGTPTLRYTFPGVGPGNCDDYAIRAGLHLPPTNEIWVEAWARFSGNFTTVVDGCGTGEHAYKFLLAFTNVSRFQLQLGVLGWAFNVSGPGGAPYPSYHQLPEPSTDEYFDGRWHRYRMHWRMNGDSTGTIRQWFDDRLVWEATEGIHPDARTFSHLLLGSNLNAHPEETMRLWWGPVRIWTEDPGW